VVGLSHRSCQTCTPRRDSGCEPLSRCGHRSRPCCSGPSIGEPTRPDASTRLGDCARRHAWQRIRCAISECGTHRGPSSASPARSRRSPPQHPPG
jgi:hypothetical protein